MNINSPVKNRRVISVYHENEFVMDGVKLFFMGTLAVIFLIIVVCSAVMSLRIRTMLEAVDGIAHR